LDKCIIDEIPNLSKPGFTSLGIFLLQVSANQSKRKIAESSKTPIEFLAKYDDLKSKK